MRLALLPLLLAACGGTSRTLSPPDLEAEAVRSDNVDVAAAQGLVLDVLTHAGDVTVEVAEGPPTLEASLRLMARTEAEAERLLAGFAVASRVEGDALAVRLEGAPAEIEGADWHVKPIVSFHARVPPGQRIRAETGSGNVSVGGPAGACTLASAFGDLKVSGARGEFVRARTSSGGIRIEGVEAELVEIDTTFGDVHVKGVRGDLDVETGSGDVSVKGFSGGACELDTGFGDIDAQGAFGDLRAKTSSGRIGVLAEAGSTVERPWSLQSSFGDVEVRVPPEFDCSLFAETSFGCVTSDLAVRTAGKLTDHRVRGELGDGGGLVTLRTSSGDIRIRAAY